MNCIVKTPGTQAVPFFRLMDHLLSDALDHSTPAQALPAPVDVSEDDTNVYVRADLPGFTKDEIDVKIEKGVLSIEAQRTQKVEEGTERYFRRERRATSLTRRLAVPQEVTESAVTAGYKDGVLTLTLPKSPKDTPRKVSIN